MRQSRAPAVRRATLIVLSAAGPATATSLLSPTGHFLNDLGQPYPTDPRLQFDSRLMFRNTINGGAIAIGNEWILHAYHAQFPAGTGGVDGYVGRLMDQFDNDGNFVATYRVVASREDFAVDYAVFKVERLDGSPANLGVWVDPRELYPATRDVAIWGSFGPQSVTIGPMGEPIQTPPHPRLVKWGTIGADRASFPGLPSDVQEVPGDSGSGIFVRDGFNLRLAGTVGSPLTPQVRQTIEQWVGQMGGVLARYPLQVGTFATSRGGAASDWFDAPAWSGGVPGASDDAWIDQHGGAIISSPGAVAGNLYIGVGQHGLSGVGSLEIGTGGELTVGRLMLGVTEGLSTPAVGTVSQSGGTAQVGSAVIGYRGEGSFLQSGGTFSVADDLVVARDIGSRGLVAASGASAHISAGAVVVGREGTGTFEQSAGSVHVAGDLTLGRFENGVGRYLLSGGSLSVGSNLFIGASAGSSGSLQISGGSAEAAQLILSRGRVELTGGAATFAYASMLPTAALRLESGTLSLIEGGTLPGTVDFAGGTATFAAGGLTDLSGGLLLNSGSAALHASPGSLVVLPEGVTASNFGTVTAPGAIVHTSGGTIEIGAGTHLTLYGAIRDFVRVEGSLIATAGIRGSDITLLRGLDVAAGGTLDLGAGGNAFVSVDSRNDGGVFRAASIRMAGGATYAQTAGVTELGITRITPAGSISVSGGTFSAGSVELRGTLLQSGGRIAVAGSTELTGRFEQTGGIARIGAVVSTNPPATAGIRVEGAALEVESMRMPLLQLGSGGVVSIDPSEVSSTTSVLRGLEIAGGASPVGTLDLGRELLVVHYGTFSPIDPLTQAVAAGHAGGTWAGPGITSSAAAAAPNLLAVGIAQASDLGVSAFGDYTLPGPAVLMRLTLAGDANLDGTVSIADFSRLAANFNFLGGWDRGDFNYDGTTTIADFALLAANFNRQLARGPANVPEPATLGAAGSVFTLVLSRRRRRG